MLEVVTIAVNVLFLLALLVLVPLGMWWLSDPSREAAGWIRDGEVALARGDAVAACRLARRAMTLPRRGRYSRRQAETTLAALELARRALAEAGREVPDEVTRLHARLAQGGGDPGDEVRAARAAFDRLDREIAP